MRRESLNGLVFYRFSSLEPFVGLVNAVFTRLGGVSRPPFNWLNVGHTVGDDLRCVEINHERIFQTLNIPRNRVITCHLVHSTRVAVVGEKHRGEVIPETDGLVTNIPGIYLMLRFADCVPIVLYDPKKRAVSLVHAGWKGSILGIAYEAVRVMQQAFGSRPDDILAGIGPSIGPCCYEVGKDVIDIVRSEMGTRASLVEKPDGSTHLDLWELNKWHLIRAGVRQVELSRLCTACHRDEFFSHRAEGGRTGRFAVILGMRPSGMDYG